MSYRILNNTDPMLYLAVEFSTQLYAYQLKDRFTEQCFTDDGRGIVAPGETGKVKLLQTVEYNNKVVQLQNLWKEHETAKGFDPWLVAAAIAALSLIIFIPPVSVLIVSTKFMLITGTSLIATIVCIAKAILNWKRSNCIIQRAQNEIHVILLEIVAQHVVKAQQILRETIEKNSKWSDPEKQLFRDVVFNKFVLCSDTERASREVLYPETFLSRTNNFVQSSQQEIEKAQQCITNLKTNNSAKNSIKYVFLSIFGLGYESTIPYLSYKKAIGL